MGFFEKIREGLKKTRDNISGKIESVINSFTRIDDDLMDELEEALILADIGASTAASVIAELRAHIKEHGLAEPSAIKDVLKDIIAEKMTGDGALHLDTKPSVILVLGVNGVGKTTAIGKLAGMLRGEGKSVLLAAGDTFRAAAADQLAIWADRAGAALVRQNEGSDPAAVVYDAAAAAKSRGTDVLICDTAGRLHNKANLMNELSKIRRVLSRELPEADTEVLLVIDATTGQNAVAQAKAFSEHAGVTGIILTKLDGTARGGVAITVCDMLKIPVKFIGVGEQIGDLMPFDAKAFTDALF